VLSDLTESVPKLGKRNPVVLGIQAAMLTVAPKASSKRGWVIFFIEIWSKFNLEYDTVRDLKLALKLIERSRI
jgi:hypothetical protein